MKPEFAALARHRMAQAVAGPALKGGELAEVSPTGELAALAELLVD